MPFGLHGINHLLLEIRLKDGSTLQSIPSLRQREHTAAGFCTISHRSCSAQRFAARQHTAYRQREEGAIIKGAASGQLAGPQGRIACGNSLTFCCLHSLQAFRQPPRRFPVTGGTFSISPESGLLCSSSRTGGGRGSRGDRKSLGGIKCGPFGARRFRYPKSIRIGLCSPDIKNSHGP